MGKLINLTEEEKQKAVLDISDILNDSHAYYRIVKHFNIKDKNDTTIFHEIEEFILDKLIEIENE